MVSDDVPLLAQDDDPRTPSRPRLLDARADLIFVKAPEANDEISSVPSEVSGPVMFNIVENGSSPHVELEHLAAWGNRPLALIAPVIRAVLRTLVEMDLPTPLTG
jgi:2-methylisocitrate lyase-like PEP mutase family enzyme